MSLRLHRTLLPSSSSSLLALAFLALAACSKKPSGDAAPAPSAAPASSSAAELKAAGPLKIRVCLRGSRR